MINYHEFKGFFFNQYTKLKNSIVPHFISKTTWNNLPNIFDAALINAFGVNIFFEIALKCFVPSLGYYSLFNILKYTANSSAFLITAYYEYYSYQLNINESTKKVIYHANEAKMIMEEILTQDQLDLEESGYGGDKSCHVNLPAPKAYNNIKENKKNKNQFPIYSWFKKSCDYISVPMLSLDMYPTKTLSYIMFVINIYRKHLHYQMKATNEKQRILLHHQAKEIKQKIRELEFRLGSEEDLQKTILEAKKVTTQDMTIIHREFSYEFPHFPNGYLFLEKEINLLISSFVRGLISARGVYMISHFFWPEWDIFNCFISIGVLLQITRDEYWQSKIKVQFQQEIKDFSIELNVLKKNKISLAETIMIYQKLYLHDENNPKKEMESSLKIANDHDTIRFFSKDVNYFHKNNSNFFMNFNEPNQRKI